MINIFAIAFGSISYYYSLIFLPNQIVSINKLIKKNSFIWNLQNKLLIFSKLLLPLGYIFTLV